MGVHVDSTSTILRLGTLSLELRGVDFEISAQGQCFDRYVCDVPPDVTIDVATGDRPMHEWLVSELVESRSDDDGLVLRVRRTEWSAKLDLQRSVVHARLEGRWPLAVGSLLKLVTQAYGLVLGRGLVLHASSVEHDGRAYVFMGPSGAGKTTVALLSQSAGMNVLSEEMTYVSLGSSDLTPHVCTLPFRQRGGIMPLPARLPVAGIYWLEQAQHDEIVEVERKAQVLRTTRLVALGVRERVLMERALAPSVSLVNRVPVKVLRFKPSTGFWEVVLRDGR